MAKQTDTEIEIKVKVQFIEPLQKFLKKNGKFKFKDNQIDQYYNHPCKDFLASKPIKEWLRLRNSNGIYSLNYKNHIYNNQGISNHRDEYETEVADINQLEKILKALGFTKLIEVKKLRESWDYQNYEISLDKVDNLGNFVEVEYIGSSRVNPKSETDKMIKFLSDLRCGKIERNYMGYPWLILFPEDSLVE